MAKKKVLILQNQILNYRIPVYEKLQKEYDVTVIHTGKKVSRDFNEIILNSYRIGPFSFLKNFRKSIKRINPDYILSMFDLHWPQYCLCLPKNTKNVFWGLDNGKSLIADFAKKKLVNYMGNNVLFYSKNVQEKWKEEINVKSFVAQNSVEVNNDGIATLFNLKTIKNADKNLVATSRSGEIVISFGLINRSLPISKISLESVAEKNKVCLILGNK